MKSLCLYLFLVVLPQWCEVWSSSPDTGVGSNSFWSTVFRSGWYFFSELDRDKSVANGLIDRFCSVSLGSSVPFQTVLPKQGSSVCSLTVCLGWASKRPTGESSHVTLMKQAVHVCCTFTYYLLLCSKLKKSGKEPKVGAEVTLGKLSQKTTVRHQSSVKGIICIVEVKSIFSFWRWVIGPLPLSGMRLSVS